MTSNKNDRSYNPYGMDFLGGVEYDSSHGVLEYERGAVPDPMDPKIAASLFLANEEQNRHTGKNHRLPKIVVSNIGGGIRMFSEPGPEPRFMTFDFPDGISEEDVAAFKQHIDGCKVYSLAKQPQFVPPSVIKSTAEEGESPLLTQKCDLCGETPCFLNQVVEGSGGKTMHEVFIGDKGDEMMEQGVPNHEICHALYCDATTFIHGYLGKGNRKQLPACVQGEIRDSFPSKDGLYTGFKKGFLENK